MDKMDKIIYGGLIIAFLISILSPFLASTNPDGLESTAEKVINEKVLHQNLEEIGLKEEGSVIPAPMPDYGIEGMGKIGEIIALVVGTMITLGLTYGLSKVLVKNKSSQYNQ